MTALEQLLALAPCYTASARISTLLEMSEAMTGDIYGVARPLAVAYLVLHWLDISKRSASGANGPVTGESEGQLSITYASSASNAMDSSLTTTGWGRELIRLRRATFISGGMRTRMG